MHNKFTCYLKARFFVYGLPTRTKGSYAHHHMYSPLFAETKSMHVEAVRVRCIYGAKLSVHIIHDMHTTIGSTVNKITST